jgi:hypothetical protein
VLNANPLTNIGNVRKIHSVYLNGTQIDRDRQQAGFNTVATTSLGR